MHGGSKFYVGGCEWVCEDRKPAEMCMGDRKQVGWGCDGQSVGWNAWMCIEHAWGGFKQYVGGGHEWVAWMSEPRDQKMTKLVQWYEKSK